MLNRTADYRKTKESIITGIKSCITSWRDKKSVPTSSFPEWKGAVMPLIDEKCCHLSTKVTTEKRKTILKLYDEIITEELKMLHNKFVVAPIDKANGDVPFVY